MKDEEIQAIAGMHSERMFLPDDINDILIKARKAVEKDIKRTCKTGDYTFLNHLRMYRVLTKLLNREPLSIFDMPNF